MDLFCGRRWVDIDMHRPQAKWPPSIRQWISTRCISWPALSTQAVDANFNLAVLPIRRLDEAALEQFQLSHEVAFVCRYARRNAMDTVGTVHARATFYISFSLKKVLHAATLAFIHTITASSV